MYTEDEMLMLSGIQHYMFCPRQWALIHIEQQWYDNKLTTEGSILHKNVDNPFYRKKNGNIITLRSIHIASKELGLYGITDAVELIPSESPVDSITIPGYTGYWKPYPIEYKRGHKKANSCDEVQLAAQVMCLEEMHHIHIPYGALFYNELKHREEIYISDSLRKETMTYASQMHTLFLSGNIPKAEYSQHCRNCSLQNICIPRQSNKVENYLKQNLYETTS